MATVPTLSYSLELIFNEPAVDDWGSWEYAAAYAMQDGQQVAQLIATKRTNSFQGSSFPASMLTATLIFSDPDGPTWANLTIQGIHDLSSNNETGSVSSGSPIYAPYIGGNFTFVDGVLTINPPAG